MRKLVKGHKYNFLVECSKNNKLFGFYIKAISKKTKRYSYINNLNCILSIFGIITEDNKVSESQWIVKEKETSLLFNRAISFLSDVHFNNLLENQLDIDRKLGEWNKLQAVSM